MRRYCSLSVIVFCCLFISNKICSQSVKDYGNLSVSGLHLVDKNNNPIMLYGVSYGWHNWWPRFYNKETVKWLAEDWECNVLRAAMGVESSKGY